MGNKKADTKKILDTIDATIKKLENRLSEIQNDTDPDTGKLTSRAQKEMAWVIRNLSLAKTARKELQETLEKTKNEEEKKRVMSGVALAMLVGAINENLRLAEERAQKEMKPWDTAKGFTQSVVEALFSSGDFRFVTEEDVKDILEDEELRQMAEADPHKLQREEQDYRAEYESMMARAFIVAGITGGDDFDENERRFREYLKKNNGFEEAITRSGDFIQESIISESEGKVSDEDRAFFKDVMKEMESLRKITRELQEKYILEEDSYEKGNGYTEELVERERILAEKLKAFGAKKLNIALDQGPEGEQFATQMMLYERSQMLYTPIKDQYLRDRVLQRNNDLRRRMERWTVYQQVPEDGRPDIVEEAVEVSNRKTAIAKLSRINRLSVRRSLEGDGELTEMEMIEKTNALREGRGDLRSVVSIWAVEDTQLLLEKINDDKPLNASALPEVRAALATLIMYQMIQDELKQPEGEPKDIYESVRRIRHQDQFRKKAKEFSETEDFRKVVDPLIKGKKMRENIYRFLANDFEKDVSKKIHEKWKRTNQKKNSKNIEKANVKKGRKI